MIRYSKASSSYQDVFDIGLLLRMKLLNQGFLLVRLKSSLRKCYGRHHAFADRYGLFLSQMTTDMFHFSTHFSGISSFMTYYRVSNQINTTTATSAAGTSYPPGAPPVFNGVRVYRSLFLYVCFVNRCLSLCNFFVGICAVCSSSIYEL